jgi:1-acyl-sn-glycerol-3-phosphate acyltransferase
MIRNIIDAILARLLLIVGHVASRVLLHVHVIGDENVPERGPLIIIANHFSWFDAPLLTLYLPFKPAFLVATESQRFWYVRMYMRAFKGIPIWRGGIDRNALRTALHRLRQGATVGIFPEGGIDPRLAEQRARGEVIHQTYGHTSRTDAQLTFPQPGTAYLAIHSQARILPVALIGTEQILGNLLRGRRTHVTMHIGQPFGPIPIESQLHGTERRMWLDHLAHQIMQRIAMLFPPENRGPYRNGYSESQPSQ